MARALLIPKKLINDNIITYKVLLLQETINLSQSNYAPRHTPNTCKVQCMFSCMVVVENTKIKYVLQRWLNVSYL